MAKKVTKQDLISHYPQARRCQRRFFASFYGFIKRAADNAGVYFLSIADEPRFVNVLAGEAEVGGRWEIIILSGNDMTDFLSPPTVSNFPPLLRRVIFVGQPALGLRLDVVRVGLGAIGGDQRIVR